MGHTVDYYRASQSPWTYLGHQRFADMVNRAGSVVWVRPMDLGKMFPMSGGLPEVQARYDICTQAAIDVGVFGSPSYVIRDEIFWGQDRLDFVERALTQV